MEIDETISFLEPLALYHFQLGMLYGYVITTPALLKDKYGCVANFGDVYNTGTNFLYQLVPEHFRLVTTDHQFIREFMHLGLDELGYNPLVYLEE